MHRSEIASPFSLLVTALLLALPNSVKGEDIMPSVGTQETVFPNGYGGLHYFSDEPISVLSTRPWSFYVVNTNTTVLMQGPTFEAATPVGNVLMPPGGTAFDSSYAGVSSVYYCKPKKELLAFYHAEDNSGMEKIPYNATLTCALWSVGLAVSVDGGITLTKIGQVLASKEAKNPKATDMRGIGDVSVCPDHTNKYLYAYYTDLSPQPKRYARVCMARSRISDGGRPGTWRKYYETDFKEPGLGGLESDILENAVHPNVTFIRSLGKYVMFFNVTRWEEHVNNKADISGIYFCHSDDGIKWSERRRLFSALDVPLEGKEYTAHPYFLLQQSTASMATGWLVYTHSPHWGNEPNVPHYLVRRSVRLTLEKDDSPDRATATATKPGQSRTNALQSKTVFSLTFDGAIGQEYENHGADFADGKVGKGLRFDGKSYVMVEGQFPSGNAPRTLSVWLKSGQRKAGFPLAYGSNGKSEPFGIMIHKGNWRFYDNGGGLSSGVQADTNWHHHCVVYDGRVITYFFDAKPVAKVERILATRAKRIVLGMSPDLGKYGGDGYEGTIDEIFIFDRAFNGDQVQTLFEAGRQGQHPDR